MGSHSRLSPTARGHNLQTKSSGTSTSAMYTTSSGITKFSSRVPKSDTARLGTTHDYDSAGHAIGTGVRHNRVWRACGRCRLKKTKCDAEFPCKRCTDDDVVCAPYARRLAGYGEVLESSHFALIATIRRLYSMVRNSQPWPLDDPKLNSRGQPVIHDLVEKLGYVGLTRDVSLPVQSAFPDDEQSAEALVNYFEERQHSQSQQSGTSGESCHDWTSSTEFEHSQHELDRPCRDISRNHWSEFLPTSTNSPKADLELCVLKDTDKPVFFPLEEEPACSDWSDFRPGEQQRSDLQLFEHCLAQLDLLNEPLFRHTISA